MSKKNMKKNSKRIKKKKQEKNGGQESKTGSAWRLVPVGVGKI
jgi:hypothetical protein